MIAQNWHCNNCSKGALRVSQQNMKQGTRTDREQKDKFYCTFSFPHTSSRTSGGGFFSNLKLRDRITHGIVCGTVAKQTQYSTSHLFTHLFLIQILTKNLQFLSLIFCKNKTLYFCKNKTLYFCKNKTLYSIEFTSLVSEEELGVHHQRAQEEVQNQPAEAGSLAQMTMNLLNSTEVKEGWGDNRIAANALMAVSSSTHTCPYVFSPSPQP